jgi:hypothetical protein
VSSLLAFFLIALGTSPTLADTILSDNTSKATAFTEIVTTTRWVTSSFGTDASPDLDLASVTLRMQVDGAGTASLGIYTDTANHPGVLVGTLTSPSSFTTTSANNTFTSSGLTLNANTTYWVVLRALTGQFEWAWTADNTGTGVGFQHTWGFSQNSGGTWNTFTSEPMIMQVVATTAVPEPSSVILLGSAALLGLGYYSRIRRRGGVV